MFGMKKWMYICMNFFGKDEWMLMDDDGGLDDNHG
jgi:hypothetical protein